MTDSYQVHIVNKTSRRTHLIGYVNTVEDSIALDFLCKYEIVNKINKKLLKFISTLEDLTFTNFYPLTFLIQEQERITVSIIKKEMHRKGTIYYVIQKSSCGIRYLVYVAYNIHHSSDCLGTNVPIKADEEFLNDFNTFLDTNEFYKNLYSKFPATLHLD